MKLNKKKVFITILIAIIIVVFVTFIIIKLARKENKNKDLVPITYDTQETISEDETKRVEDMTSNLGLEADTNLYEVAQEYDGREYVRIKPEIQFNTVMAGVLLNNQKPEFQVLQEILKQAPIKYGIWIEETSREKFLELLTTITKGNYTINEEGYLIQDENSKMNQYDKKIKKMITSNNLYVIDISSKYYILNEATGEVVENPFEDMDPYSPYEPFDSENKFIFFISENKQGKINQEEALKEILK